MAKEKKIDQNPAIVEENIDNFQKKDANAALITPSSLQGLNIELGIQGSKMLENDKSKKNKKH